MPRLPTDFYTFPLFHTNPRFHCLKGVELRCPPPFDCEGTGEGEEEENERGGFGDGFSYRLCISMLDFAVWQRLFEFLHAFVGHRTVGNAE